MYLLAVDPIVDDYYWRLSDNILRHGSLGLDGIVTTQFEPLYPLLVAAARAASGDSIRAIAFAQVMLDSAAAVALYYLATALTGRPRVAITSAVLYGLYPLLVRHAVVLADPPLLSALLILFCLAFTLATTPARMTLAGLCLGLAMLTRTAIAPVLVLAAAALIARARWKDALVLAVTSTAVVSPWLVRNAGLNGTLWPTRGGINLFIGNSAYTAALLPEYTPDLLTTYAQGLVTSEASALAVATDPATERGRDEFFAARAFDSMRARPLRTLGMTAAKAAYLFWPRLVPSHIVTARTVIRLGDGGVVDVENSPARPLVESVAYTASYMFVGVAALAGIFLRRRRLGRDAALWCIVFSFITIYAVYFPATRYRAPMEFVLLFYAAVALDNWSWPR